MNTIMVSAMQSGAGKTVLTCAVIRALQQRGLSVAGFKCGPDYLDPMFHARVLDAPSHNLDLFLQGDVGVRQTLGSVHANIAVIEGAMGLFDGIGGTEEASAWQLAAREGIPVVLAVRPGGSSLTLAAQIRGLCSFRCPNVVAGIVLTACRPTLAAHLSPIIERECELPVLGYLPPMEEASFASRHLGLVTADEVPDLSRRVDEVARQLEQTCDLDGLITLACRGGSASTGGPVDPSARHATATRASMDSAREELLLPNLPQTTTQQPAPRCRIAVARDEAFCFYDDAGLARLEACGAELVAFSPLHDKELPAVDALYLGGGYPELHAAELAANEPMRRAMREAALDGMPTVAECGGFMYLQEELTDEQGATFPMVGALPGQAASAGRLVRFGYAWLEAEKDSLLLRAGERIPVHEFHRWDSTHNGTDLAARKPTGESWRCCHATDSLHAGFPHLHFAGELPLAERFVARAAEFGRGAWR